MPRPWNKRIYPAQREAEKERLAERSAETDHAAAELRRSTFVNTMTALATELAPERPVERPEQAYTIEGEHTGLQRDSAARTARSDPETITVMLIRWSNLSDTNQLTVTDEVS
jgi:hypothetical protein